MNCQVVIEILKSKTLCVTNNRIVMLQFLLMHNSKLIKLSDILKIHSETLDRITIYRMLGMFCNVGLISKVIDVHNKTHYSVAINIENKDIINYNTCNEHYHFQCKRCSEIICLPNKIEKIQLPDGFVCTEANLMLFGHCITCAEILKELKTEKKKRYTIKILNAKN